MVASVHFVVNKATDGLEMRRAHHMVDTQVETLQIERQAQAAARRHKTVGKMGSNDLSGIGNGGVVEVAADYHRHLVVQPDEGSYAVSLCGSYPRSLQYLS